MGIADRFDRLQFEEDPVLNDDVSAEPLLEALTPVLDGNRHLTHCIETSFAYFVEENDFVNRFQQSWAKLTVYGYRRIHNFPADVILIHSARSLRLCEILFL